jgi:amidase
MTIDSHDEGMPRRTFLSGLAMGVSASSLFQDAAREAAPLTADTIVFASASALARGIRLKRVSSLEVIDAHLKRIAQVNPKINALVLNAADQAREAARAADRAVAEGKRLGPLHGVPVSIKDSFDVAGMVSTAGTAGWAKRIPSRDATVVARLRAAGCIIVGKTNTPEFTMSDETENLVYGRTNNPYDLTRTPGGSSGGPAALVASGGSPLDVGSDTGNSIRMPSHFCGIAGIKPTSGRVSRAGHAISYAGHIESWTQLGPMARYVEDLILVLPIISGPDGIDPHVMPVPLQDPAKVVIRGLRVAVHENNGIVTPTPETQAAVRSAAQVLRARGARVEEKAPPALAEYESLDFWRRVAIGDGGAWVRRLLQAARTPGAGTMPWLATLSSLPPQEFTRAIEQMDEWRSRMLGFMRDVDVILCPVHPTPAVPHGGSASPEFALGDSYSTAYNITGWPGAAVRAGVSREGLPIAVQVVGQPWREDIVLAVAKVIETDLGGWKRPSL